MAKTSDIDALRKTAADAYEAWAQASARVDEAVANAASDEPADEPEPEAEPATPVTE